MPFSSVIPYVACVLQAMQASKAIKFGLTYKGKLVIGNTGPYMIGYVFFHCILLENSAHVSYCVNHLSKTYQDIALSTSVKKPHLIRNKYLIRKLPFKRRKRRNKINFLLLISALSGRQLTRLGEISDRVVIDQPCTI